MTKGFKRFKKKFQIVAIVKALAIGFSIPFTIYSVLFILNKLLITNFNMLLMLLFAFIAALVLAGISYLILCPSNARVAKILDNELDLNERVQTMLEFENSDNIIAGIQREDTNNRLMNTSLKMIKIKNKVVYIVLMAISVAILSTSLVIPAKAGATNPGPDDPNYNVTKWQLVAVNNIIEYIERSEATDRAKNDYIDVLEALLLDLENVEKLSEMQGYVTGSISQLELKLDLINTNNEIYEIYKQSEDPTIENFAVYVYTCNYEYASNWIDALKMIDCDDMLGNPALNENLNTYYYELGKNLEDNHTVVFEGDPLYDSLVALAKEFKGLQNKEGNSQQLLVVTDVYKILVYDAVYGQYNNDEVCKYAVDQLLEIFDLKNDDNENDNPDGSSSTNEPTDSSSTSNGDIQGTQGGLADGEKVYGSDESFYDPEIGECVYGDVIASYYAYVDALIAEGKISEETAASLLQYFDILLGTYKENEEQEGNE